MQSHPWRRWAPRIAGCLLVLMACLGWASTTLPATLPHHGLLRILIVSDEVNPHGLSDAELTQPGDLLAALSNPASGLAIDPSPDGIIEIASDDIQNATALLNVSNNHPAAYDVLVYFAHRAPAGAAGPQNQADFVSAVEGFLQRGGGVVSFHHGSYLGSGKAAMQELIGATATGNVSWNTTDGQNVINVAPGHFITTFHVDYTGTTTYADPGRGVPSAAYPFFNNLPDERYPNFEINPSAGSIEMLFGSDFNENGTAHLLGFIHQRADWAGFVVAYQPGEYQPNALDDMNGNNFQILVNSIYFAAEKPVPVPAADTGRSAALAVLLLAAAWLGMHRRVRQQ